MRQNKKLPQKLKGKQFAFVVDGKCEYWYMQMLKKNEQTINVTLKPELSRKKPLSEQYKQVIELAKDYDKVFWIVDFDVIIRETDQTRKGAKSALQKFKEYHEKIARKEKIIIIINNPCFEYWHLLHFAYTSKDFGTCEKVMQDLKKYLPDYSKTEKFYTKENNDIYLRLKPFINTAIKNAKKLPAFDLSNPHQGITQMQLFFDIKEIADIINR